MLPQFRIHADGSMNTLSLDTVLVISLYNLANIHSVNIYQTPTVWPESARHIVGQGKKKQVNKNT